ncbi:MAG TPA: dihydropteroate synthase [Flavobacteriales bacterium]|nr:dihydropteroate synthase [Flavobacteriales bacterium]
MDSLRTGPRLLELDQVRIFGILNLSPDSFFSGSRISGHSMTIDRAGKMLEEGADILDLGAASTRPGAEEPSIQEELDRLIPAIEAIHKAYPEALISADTYRSEVAHKAHAAGAVIINDVSGGNLDEAMFRTVAELGTAYVLTHMRGNPKTMNELANYNSVTYDVIRELSSKVKALHELGVHDILIDPGIGFAKNAAHNFQLIRELELFRIFPQPLLMGISRKRFIWQTLNSNPEEALNGTTAMHMLCLNAGAKFLRVHDVKEAREVIQLFQEG